MAAPRLPLAGLAAAFALGIAGAGVPYPLYAAAAAVAVAALLFALRRRFWAILVATAAAGCLCGVLKAPAPLPPGLADRKATYTARITHVEELETAEQRLTAEVEGYGKPFGLRVNYMSLSPQLVPGQKISFTARLRAVKEGTDLPDEMDYGALMLRRGIVATTTVEPKGVQTVEGRGSFAGRCQAHLVDAILSLPLTPEAGAFLAATIVGDADFITDDSRVTLARAGIAHVLALSGLHVGIIAMIVMWVLYPLTFYGLHRLRLVVAIAALWGFALLTGMSPSVVRATLMATVVMAGKIFQQRPESLNTLSLAALVILVATPRALLEPGFQLSFVAVGSILVWGEAFRAHRPRSRVLYIVGGFVVTSTAAMLAAGVLSIVYFHIFPVYFLLGNLIATFLLPLLLVCAVVLLVVSALVSNVPQWAAWPVDTLYDLMERTASAVTHLPGAAIDDLYVSPWVMVPVGGIVVAGLLLHTSLRRLMVPLIGALAVMAVCIDTILTPDYPKHELYITRHWRHTTLVARDGSNAWLITTAYPAEHQGVLSDAQRHYTDYLRLRRLGDFRVAPDSLDGAWLSRRGPIIRYGERSLGLLAATADTARITQKVDKLLIARGFTGDVIQAALHSGADTVVLSTDLHPKRARRYLRELSAAGIPARLLVVQPSAVTGRH